MEQVASLLGRQPRTSWSTRVGVAGFTFFVVKGLLWLVAPLVLYWLG